MEFLKNNLGSGRTQPRHLGWARKDPTQCSLHEQWTWIIIHAHCSCVNSRTLTIIHVYCSLSRQRRRRKGRGRRLTCGGSLAAMRRLGQWLSRLRWRECWLVSVAGDRRSCRGEARRSRSRWLFCHWWGFGFVGRLRCRLLVEEKGVCGGFKGWRHGGERRKGGKCWLEPEMTGFLADFGPNFIHPWSMKITSIYRWWKRDTFSLLVPNFGPWFDPKALQPLLQRNNEELPVLCRKIVGRVGYFGAVPPLYNLDKPERFILACSQVSQDHFRAGFIQFEEETRRQTP